MRLPDNSGLHPTEHLGSRSMAKDQRLYPQAASGFAERRKAPRTEIRKPAYINFEPYNQGGVITDISETGLRFHAVDPLERGGIVRVSIFLGAASHIEAVGELIWKDSTHRIGGLRFTVLPAGAADQIRNWAEASNVANPSSLADSESGASPRDSASQDAHHPSTEASSTTDSGASERTSEPKVAGLPQPPSPQVPGSDASARSPWVPRSIRPATSTPGGQMHSQDLPNAGRPSPGQHWVPPAAYQQPSAMPWITHFDPDPPQRRSIFVRGVLGGIVITVMLAAAGWFAAGHYMQNGGTFEFANPFASHPSASSSPAAPPEDLPSAQPRSDVTNDVRANSLPSEQSQPAPSSDSAPDSAVTQPSAPPQNTLAQGPSAAVPPSDTLSTARGSLPAAQQPAAKASAAQPSGTSDAGAPQLSLALQYLDGRSHPRNPAAASQLLWSAVEKGNSTAETDLADLYLRGDGVAKNCDQARILLSAASDRGNTEAMQKLTELNRTGCR
jgi:hypothetical protein